jgi:hypothetical protein
VQLEQPGWFDGRFEICPRVAKTGERVPRHFETVLLFFPIMLFIFLVMQAALRQPAYMDRELEGGETVGPQGMQQNRVHMLFIDGGDLQRRDQ